MSIRAAAADRALDARRHKARRDRNRRDRIATKEEHLALVVNIAESVQKNIPSEVLSLDDLIGAGNIGLLRAAAKFSPESNNAIPFRIFARYSIRGAMLDAIRAVWCDGENRRGLRPRLASLDQIMTAIESRTSGHSGAGPISSRDEAALAKAAHLPIAESRIDKAREKKRVSDAMMLLSPDERALLKEWYAAHEPSLYRVARRFRMTKEAAGELHDSAVAKLRAIVTQAPRPRA